MSIVAEAMSRELVIVHPDATVGAAKAAAAHVQVRHVLVTDEGNLVGILCLCDLRSALTDERVCDFMSVPVLTITPEMPLEDAADTMVECEVGCLPVACGGLLLGTLTDEDLVRAGVSVARHGGCHCGSAPKSPHA